MISVFDIFKIGIGPSSSHTVGPMKASNKFVSGLIHTGKIDSVKRIKIKLYGSLAYTGKGHGTDRALIWGLMGEKPEKMNLNQAETKLLDVYSKKEIDLSDSVRIVFDPQRDLKFKKSGSLPLHSNGIELEAFSENEMIEKKTFYSIGGGFLLDPDDQESLDQQVEVKHPFRSSGELLAQCEMKGVSISTIIFENEKSLKEETKIISGIENIWEVMRDSITRGCHQEGVLPGNLKVKRRAPELYKKLAHDNSHDPLIAMDWVNLFALAVNEENAAGGRVVTAPTNGAAGIIPAVLAYYDKFVKPIETKFLIEFFLTATAIGSLYKMNASISGAEVGCQGEVGVACSMAAGALAAVLGGSPKVVENAAEIGMEHNLGLTCDPIGGLVQVPCIERNAMGATKAINAARLAIRGTGEHKVSLDKVIQTMQQTGKDMKSKYKETSKGGLAVNVVEC